jgi:hypothetical protein
MTTSVDVKTEPFRILAGKAADYIRKHGWCHGSSSNESGAVCPGEAGWIEKKDFPPGTFTDLAHYMWNALGSTIAEWNDHPSRTASEVVGVLDAISEGWL